MRYPNYPERIKVRAERKRLRGWSYKLSPREIAEGRMQHRFGPAVMLREPKQRYDLRDCDDRLIIMLRPLLVAKNAEARMMVGEGYVRRVVWRIPRYSGRDTGTWIAEAAHAGYPIYIYIVGANYDMGEGGYPLDRALAVEYFKKAAALGHAHSKWLCSEHYLFGAAADRNEVLGLQLLHRAAQMKFYGALFRLADFHEEGLHGFDKDPEKAAFYRRAMNAPDVIGYT